MGIHIAATEFDTKLRMSIAKQHWDLRERTPMNSFGRPRIAHLRYVGVRTQPLSMAADKVRMIDLNAPDPFSLKSWTANVMPVDDADARAWWLASMIAAVVGRAVIDDLAVRLAVVWRRARA